MTGQRTGSSGAFPESEVFFNGGKTGYPFSGAETHVATSADLLIVGTAEETEWKGFTEDGVLSTIVRWPDYDRAVTQDRVDGLTDTLASQLSPGNGLKRGTPCLNVPESRSPCLPRHPRIQWRGGVGR